MKSPRKIAIGFQEGVCPLRCNKCPAFGTGVKKNKEIAKMPIDRVKFLIDKIAKLDQIPIIQPCIYAEPFANPDLKEIIIYCNKYNIPMSIITNGILIDEHWVDFLLEYTDRRYTVSFSLDAFTQKTYEKVRGNYQLSQIEEIIETIISKRGDIGPRITVNFTVEEENEKEAKLFIEKWKYKVDGVRITVGVDSQRKIPDRYKRNNESNIKCGFLDETMVIDADGQVRICTYDAFGDTNLGNVFEMEILQIWNSESMQKIRKSQSQGTLLEEDFCRGCEAGSGAMKKTSITEDFIINEADYAIYYNIKDNYNLPLSESTN